MNFDVAQRFAASIAGVKQTSLKLRAEASAGLPRSVRGYGFVARDVLGTWGWFRTMYRAPRVHFAFGEMPHIEGHAGLWRGMFSERGGGFVLCTARRAFIRFRGTGAHQGACVLRPSSARVEHPGSAAGLPRSVRGVCRFVASDCMTKCRDYEFRVLDPSALFTKKSQKNC